MEFLAARWLHLTTEQTYPFGITVDDPRDLRSSAHKKFAYGSVDGDLPADVDEEVFRFEGRHDLARALRGLTLPTVFLLREGETVLVATGQVVEVAARQDVFGELAKIGDIISERLALSRSERARAAVDAWRERRHLDPRQLVRIASGDAKVGTPSLDYWELANEPGADSELAAAARFMRGATPSAYDLELILNTIRQSPRAQCASLDGVTRELKSTLDDTRQKDHYEQGYALALGLRRRLALSDDKSVDVEAIVRAFGVNIVEKALSPAIDAVGCWGDRHGPTVIVNVAGRRSRTIQGRRATIAHELCHLLADRATALPLAEVMGGASPYLPERRANAFAAEFLLPRWQARAAYKEKQSLDKALTSLTVRFRISQGLAAAQLLNASNTGVSQSEQSKLEKIVKEDRD